MIHRRSLRALVMVVTALAFMASGVTTAVAAPPAKGSSLTGSGYVNGDQAFSVDAWADARSTTGHGTYVHELWIGHFKGNVTCLVVQDGRVGMAGTIDPETTVETNNPYFIYYAVDQPTLGGELVSLSFRYYDFEIADCTPQDPISPAQVTAGDIVFVEGKKLR